MQPVKDSNRFRRLKRHRAFHAGDMVADACGAGHDGSGRTRVMSLYEGVAYTAGVIRAAANR